MSDLVITIKLPEDLVKRAETAGIKIAAQVEAQTEQLIAALEKEIRRAEATKSLNILMDKADALPENIKPSEQEIESEVRSYRAQKRKSIESDGG